MKRIIILYMVLIVANTHLDGINTPMEDRFVIPTESTDSLPSVLPKNHADLVESRLRLEAVLKFSGYQLPENIQEWEKYKIKLRNEIIRKAGVKIDHALPIDIKETGTQQLTGYTIKNIYFQTRPGIYATANLYIPDGKGPFPGVVVMCGHSPNGRLYDKYQSLGNTLALNGYVALSIDPWGAGERSTIHGAFEYHGANLGASLMNIGESLMGMQISDNMRGVDLLSSLPYVDAGNIGATGGSGGGNQTMWLAAVDERVKAAVPVVSVGTFESYIMRSNCICELLIDGFTFTEEAGVLALANAIMPCSHQKDLNPAFFPTEMLRSYNNAKPIFKMRDAEDNISYRIFDLTHGYELEDRQAMLGWFDLKLKGVGTGVSKIEVPFSLVPTEKMMTFKNGQRNNSVVSTEEYCKRKGNELRTIFLNAKSFNNEQKNKELRSILRINEKSDLKIVHHYSAKIGWDRLSLETTDGKLIPLLHLSPVNKSLGYVIVCNPEGKKSISLSLIDELKNKGAGIVIVDLSGTGENSSFLSLNYDYRAKLNTLSRAELWLGKTVLGEWVRELNVVTQFLNSNFSAQKVSIDGCKEAGLAGLFMGALEGNVDNITLRDAPISYLFDNRESIDFFSMGIHLPGFLNWGDVSLAAALCGKNVTFIRSVTMSGNAIIGDKLRDVDAEFEKIRSLSHQPGKTVFK